jgi:hypothetical protein
VASMIRVTKHNEGVIAAHAAEWLMSFAGRLDAAEALGDLLKRTRSEETTLCAAGRALVLRARLPIWTRIFPSALSHAAHGVYDHRKWGAIRWSA